MCSNKANFNPGFSQINYDRTNQNVLPGGEGAIRLARCDGLYGGCEGTSQAPSIPYQPQWCHLKQPATKTRTQPNTTPSRGPGVITNVSFQQSLLHRHRMGFEKSTKFRKNAKTQSWCILLKFCWAEGQTMSLMGPRQNLQDSSSFGLFIFFFFPFFFFFGCQKNISSTTCLLFNGRHHWWSSSRSKSTACSVKTKTDDYTINLHKLTLTVLTSVLIHRLKSKPIVPYHWNAWSEFLCPAPACGLTSAQPVPWSKLRERQRQQWREFRNELSLCTPTYTSQ